MGTLKNDIQEQSKWIVKAFAADKFNLDYTIDSFIAIDIFLSKHTFNGKAKPGGRLQRNLGPVLFSIAAYIGETIIKTVPGTIWITDDTDPEGELNVCLKLPDEGILFPTQRIMKRFKNGQEDSIYVYGHSATEKFTRQPFNESYWKQMQAKAWWKFW
jgi:hypothetical protein